jgi:hypothetical protein
VIDGRRHVFSLFGIYNGVFAMKDDAEGSIWGHLDGLALQGPRTGDRMDLLPLMLTTWEKWRELHPETVVLSEETQWKGVYMESRVGRPGLSPIFVASVVNWDSRLPEETLVLGVEVEGTAVAYPLKLLDATGSVVNAESGRQPYVVLHDPAGQTALAFSRVVDGETLEFTSSGGLFTDAATGSSWDVSGRAVAGPLAGTQLDYVPSFVTEWYGWSGYHPETGVHDYDLALDLIGPGKRQPYFPDQDNPALP